MSTVRPSVPHLDPERAKLERRRQIVDAATQVFAELGYHGASINAIIERAAIARGTFYLYFESKAAVFDSILDHAMTDLRSLIHRIEVEDPAAPPPQVQLRNQMVAALGYVIGDRALATLLLKAGHTPDAEAAERLGQFFGEIHGLIMIALKNGVPLGLTRPGDHAVVAAALLGSVRGVIEHVITIVPPAVVPDIAHVVDELIMLNLGGLLPR